MDRYNYYKAHYQINGSPKWVFVEGPSWGPDEEWVKKKIMERFPDASPSSIHLLRCSKEEYDAQTLDYRLSL